MSESSLENRFRRHLTSLGLGAERCSVLVAFSGGLDSTVLLHLLRFAAADSPIRLTAAHLDHGMRAASGNDAAWAEGLCTAWGVPFVRDRLDPPPRSETDARAARYAFLRTAAAARRCDLIATAHHADDQAETVLFRVLRGTGVSGLRGMAGRTRSGLVRPLLPFRRDEIAAHADAHGLAWREDASNAERGAVRNRIRNEILPLLEREIAPGARRSLQALAANARDADAVLRVLAQPLYRRAVRRDDGEYLLDRPVLRELDGQVAAWIVREALRRLGNTPNRVGTRLAVQFITDAPSGRELQLEGGVRLRTEFDAVRIRPAVPEDSEADVPLRVEQLEPGGTFEGAVRVGGRTFRVYLGVRSPAAPATAAEDGWRVELPLGDLRFPLLLRGRAPGDRVRTAAGTKTLKKLMIEARVPVSERPGRPVLVDRDGRVLWVAGLATAKPAAPPDRHRLEVVLERDDRSV